MAIKITDESMTSDRTRHTARLVHYEAGDAWHVSWLPGRVLDRNAAITAMNLAQTVGGGLEPGDRRWPHIDAWAEELGLTGPDAVVRAAEPGHDWHTAAEDPDRDRVEDAEMAGHQAGEPEAGG
jgi:hypothetical protein